MSGIANEAVIFEQAQCIITTSYINQLVKEYSLPHAFQMEIKILHHEQVIC